MSAFYRVAHTHLYAGRDPNSFDPFTNVCTQCNEEIHPENMYQRPVIFYCKTLDRYYCEEHASTHLPFTEELA